MNLQNNPDYEKVLFWAQELFEALEYSKDDFDLESSREEVKEVCKTLIALDKSVGWREIKKNEFPEEKDIGKRFLCKFIENGKVKIDFFKYGDHQYFCNGPWPWNDNTPCTEVTHWRKENYESTKSKK